MAAFLDALIAALRELLLTVGHIFSIVTYLLFVVIGRLCWALSLVLILVAFVFTLPVVYMKETMRELTQSANNFLVSFIADTDGDDDDTWLCDLSLPDYEGGGFEGFKYLFATLGLPFIMLLFVFILLVPIFEMVLFLPLLLVTFIVHTRYHSPYSCVCAFLTSVLPVSGSTRSERRL
jgi:uncharacterized membrane protein